MTRNHRLGLSQLELMIALAIMTLIAVFLANVLDFNRQSLDRAGRFSDRAEQVLTRETLRHWIEEMPHGFGTGTARDGFEGTGTQLRFQTLVIDGTFWAGELTEVTIGLDATGDMMMSARGRHAKREDRLHISRVLATEIGTMTLSYYGRMSGADRSAWHNAWADEGRLPDLVKLEWTYTSGRPAPPLTLVPAKTARQRYMSLSSLVPPG